jgi:hypothetical protein
MPKRRLFKNIGKNETNSFGIFMISLAEIIKKFISSTIKSKKERSIENSKQFIPLRDNLTFNTCH